MIINRRYSLNDIVQTIPAVLKKTGLNGLAIALVAALPGSLLYAFGISQFLGVIGVFLQQSRDGIFQDDPQALQQAMLGMASPYCILVLSAILLSLGAIFIQAMVARMASEPAPTPEKPHQKLWYLLKSLFGRVFSYWFIFIALVMTILVLTILLIVFLAFCSMPGFVLDKHPALVIIGIVLTVIACIASLIWLTTKLAFSLTIFGFETEQGVFTALDLSFKLTRGRFWQTFGVLTLVSIVVSFSLSLATGPFLFAGVMPAYLNYMKELVQNPYNADPSALFDALGSGTSWIFALIAFIQTVVSALVTGAFMVLFYLDAKTRKSEESAKPATQSNNTPEAQ